MNKIIGRPAVTFAAAAFVAVVAASILAVTAASAQQFTMKLSSPTINDVTHEYYKALKAGVDPVHFGIVVTVNLAIGLFHPPFGINIFVAQSVLGLKLETIYRGIIPFVIIYLIALALITYIPDISLIGVRYLLARG